MCTVIGRAQGVWPLALPAEATSGSLAKTHVHKHTPAKDALKADFCVSFSETSSRTATFTPSHPSLTSTGLCKGSLHLQPAAGIAVSEVRAATSKDISLASFTNFEFLQNHLSPVADFTNTTRAIHGFGSVHQYCYSEKKSKY